MSYTALACCAVVIAAIVDLVIFRTALLRRRIFWVSYAIIVFFQFVTNGLLTGLRVVRYDGAAIVGGTSPSDRVGQMFGDGRFFYAPVEDVLFGFALVLFTLSLWVLWGRVGVGREPVAGPARFQPTRTSDAEPSSQ